MLFFAFSLATLLSSTLATHAPAQPPAQRTHCSVDFQGRAVSITDSAREWSPGQGASGSSVVTTGFSQAAEWVLTLVETHGAREYYISPKNNTNLFVAIDSHERLVLEPKRHTLHQQWRVECTDCGKDPVASRGGVFNSACNVRNAASGLCAQTPEGPDTLDKSPIFLQHCTGESFGRQNFDMHIGV